MAHGGKRPGAGRKPGSATRKTREIADRAAEEGITPLEVMLGAMRDLWAKGEKLDAAAIAKDAAPFVHPRLSNVEAKVDGDTRHFVIMGVPEAEGEEEWVSQHAPQVQ